MFPLVSMATCSAQAPISVKELPLREGKISTRRIDRYLLMTLKIRLQSRDGTLEPLLGSAYPLFWLKKWTLSRIKRDQVCLVGGAN